MIDINGLDCCGIKEIVDIDNYTENPKQIILDICEDYYKEEHMCAFYIFSDIQKKKAGKNLKNFIQKNKLGLITLSPIRINPNSGNSLRVYLWTIDKKNLKQYWHKNNNYDVDEY